MATDAFDFHWPISEHGHDWIRYTGKEWVLTDNLPSEPIRF